MALNLLLVDDSATVRSLIKKCIEMASFSVNEIYEANHGKEALEIIENSWIDMVFTDINMPEMNGVEFIEALKEQGKLQDFPVIVVSTEGSQTRIEELKAMGIKGYLRKPFTPEQIKEIIEQVTGVRDVDGN